VSNSGRKSQLCPNCRRLISVDEPRCPYCGLSAPGSRWKNNPLTRGLSGDQLIRAIIYANIALYLLSLVIQPRAMGLNMNPLRLLAPTNESVAALGATGTWLRSIAAYWWTLISASYLHGSIMHIFFNLFALYQIGPLIIQLYGAYRFMVIYTLSGAAGFLVSYYAGVYLTLGASASLCGLIGAALYYGKNRGGTYGQAVFRQIGGWAVGILLFGFLIPRINNWAHFGGFAAGILLAMALSYNEKRREDFLHRALSGFCLLITILILLWSIFRGLRFLLGV
jgi:rhomboid protease GluP